MLIQIVITLTGIAAIWLANDPRESWRRYACLFGLAGQPAWIYTAWESEQWGVVLLTAVYTVAWGKGFVGQWVKG